jgi:hypothetical protein
MRATQLPLLQKYPARQSVSTEHEVLHVVAAHPKTPQAFVLKLHAPAPLQPAGSDSLADDEVCVQLDAELHVVEPPG